ncbi:TetR/AcrR family transcriptional regulator [Streptomyces djakartensis]|uniref:TetR family transcriptional regulator n=1 Tax=Streptomyces djakartensis TaxID=68193 RepID=A0ABQ3AC97_9ACTN|nr:TetR/AcrR family transcriptional regulator [Streptomyces djakartensis]GGY41915.1 TetR family transcriptional regulator [Streptomyces djakartensis]
MTSVEEPARPGERERIRDAARTRAEILDVATQEFARAGYDGARVDDIAARTRTTKRMIYYYFGGKEQLFTAVLERAYGAIRDAEQRIDVEHLDPVAAIRRLAEVTFDHHEQHPDFIRLVSIENIHEAHHIAASEKLGRMGSPALDVIRRILEEGRRSGLFTADVDAVDLHVMISSFCFFRVSNRYTFGALFGRDLVDPAQRAHYRAMLGDMVIAYLTAERTAG